MSFNKVCVICESPFVTFQFRALTCSSDCHRKRKAQTSGREAWQTDIPSGTVGAITELVIATDLMKRGYSVFRALSPACFCDLIAINDNEHLFVEARTGYRAPKSGNLSYPKKTRGSVNVFAVFVPITSEIFYLDIEQKPFQFQ
jgi:hypothetical protein